MTDTRVGGILFLVLSGLYGWFAADIPLDFFSRQETFNARSMPLLLAAAGATCSMLMIVLPSPRTDFAAWRQLRWREPTLLLLLMWAYASVFELLGFAVATTLFLSMAITLLGERRPIRILAVVLPLTGGFWLLMDLLGIYLAPGDLFSGFIGAPGS